MDRVDTAINDVSVNLIDAHLLPEQRFRAIRDVADALLRDLEQHPVVTHVSAGAVRRRVRV